MGCCNGTSKIIHGATGLAKSVAGIGYADEPTIEQRRIICRACPEAVPCTTNVKKFCTCAKCGCRLKHKTRLKSETCPLGKW